MPVALINFSFAVICRIGSLENINDSVEKTWVVICRIGSLEIEKIKEADKK